MKVFVINLAKRTDRLESFTKEAKEQGFEFEVQPGVIFKHDRKKGITISHKACVQKAKDLGLPMVAIMEDDCRFFGIWAWDYFLSQIPESFDLFMSMVYVGSFEKNNRINSVCSGMTGYIIHERFYDRFLSLPDSCHVDREITKYHKEYEFFVCEKFVCEQSGVFSDNSLTTCDYSPLLKGRKIYGKN